MTDHQLNRRHSLGMLIAAGVALLLFVLSVSLWPRNHITIGVEGRQVVTFPGPRLLAIPYTRRCAGGAHRQSGTAL